LTSQAHDFTGWQGGLPLAGLSTRFLPATKVIRKDMLSIADKPVIQSVVDQTGKAGIEKVHFHNRTKLDGHLGSLRQKI
jgi:UTP-glucose-1-phosphate uridylyltransferase